MDLASKLSNPKQFVLFYGTTPPRANTPEEKARSTAEKLVERIGGLPLDGIVVYDVQDESSRTSAPRPFPFLPTIDSRTYAHLLHSLTGTPVITYKSVAQASEEAWDAWLTETRNTYGIDYLSLVGLPSSRNAQSSLSLSKATQVAAAHPAGFVLGGVAIAERHSEQRSESQRLLQKAAHGCSFFISQAVYHPETTIRLLQDYHRDCQEQGVAPRRIVLTFVPCGRAKTMEFIKWLGIAIPPQTEQAILSSPTPVAESINVCCANLRAILEQPYAETLPLGINVESVSIYRDEIDGSIELFHALKAVLDEYRQQDAPLVS